MEYSKKGCSKREFYLLLEYLIDYKELSKKEIIHRCKVGLVTKEEMRRYIGQYERLDDLKGFFSLKIDENGNEEVFDRDSIFRFVFHIVNESSVNDANDANPRKIEKNIPDCYLAKSMPQIYNRQSSIKMIGRKEDLKKIDKIFNPKLIRENVNGTTRNKEKLVQLVSFYGIGGEGKTVLCEKYVSERKGQYDDCIWISCQKGRNHSPLRQLKELFKTLGIKTHDESEKNVKINCQHYWHRLSLRCNKKLLVVYDNASILKDERITETLPENFNNIDVLINARRSIGVNLGIAYRLDKMKTQDAITLFIERANILPGTVPETTIEDIVNSLENHALSITLAAAYVKDIGVDNIKDLIQALEQEGPIGIFKELNSEDGYPLSLLKVFELNYQILSEEAQSLLLLLSLFPNNDVPKICVKNIYKLLKPNSSTSTKLVGELERHALISHTGDKDQDIIFHDLVYDLCQYLWNKAEFPDVNSLEIPFVKAASIYASKSLKGNEINHKELSALTSLLVPTTEYNDKNKSWKERVDVSLMFWLKNTGFQQFIYDTEFQEILVEPLVPLHDYLIANDINKPKYDIVIGKLVGHKYYANRDEYGELAQEYFAISLSGIEKLERSNSIELKNTIKWYRIFLRDHHCNVVAYSRDNVSTSILNDKEILPLLKEIEGLLGKNLCNINNSITKEDYELLLRAAHYWGHRGNQDNFSLYKNISNGTTSSEILKLGESSKQHYLRAATYRLCALKAFNTKAFRSKFVPRGKYLSDIPDWLDALEPTDHPYESFTSIYQAIADTAHQYRGLCFNEIIRVVLTFKQGKQVSLLQAQHYASVAHKLWSKAENVRDVKSGEMPLKYSVWMVSIDLLLDLLADFIEKRSLPKLDELKLELTEKLKKATDNLRIGYAQSVGQQHKHVEEIYQTLNKQQ